MNIFKRYLNSKKSNRIHLEDKVIELSNYITKAIDLIPQNVDEDVKFRGLVKGYNIVSTSRCFTNGWVRLFEIVPVGYNTEVGFANFQNPPWITVEGTRTTNLPPNRIIKEFKSNLEKALKDG